MSSKSNTQGRAYEYAFLMSLADAIKDVRPVQIEENSSLEACKKSWDLLSMSDKNIYALSSKAAVVNLFKLEPRILENSQDCVNLLIQPDRAGEDGDVRDILIIRSSIDWEIGLSMKHNNFAVKHSRLSSRLDFGDSWFGVSCSDQYWKDIAPIFSMLEQAKNEGVLFSNLPNKEDDVYIPILEAFQKELVRIFKTHADAPAKLVEYLLGRYDFYKVISVDNKKYTCIQAVNLHGTLNKPSDTEESCFAIPRVKLPTRVIHIGFIPESKTTVELYMDEGWQFTFRIHNAKKTVESSLKFDIKIIGMPTAVITLNCRWI